MWGLFNLAQVHQFQGDFGRARVLAAEALRISPRNFRVLDQLVRIAEDDGEYERIETVLRVLLTEALERRAQGDAGRVLNLLGRLTRKRGNVTEARRLGEESLAIARTIGLNDLTYHALHDLGNLAWADGDRRESHTRLAEWLNLAQYVGNYQFIALGLLVGAQRAVVGGALGRAVRLFGAADLAMPQYRFETELFDLATYEQTLTIARAALSTEAFTSAWVEGHAMTLEQAVAYALADDVVGGASLTSGSL
jgi:tetratricopeptide (TPR) repeat protein